MNWRASQLFSWCVCLPSYLGTKKWFPFLLVFSVQHPAPYWKSGAGHQPRGVHLWSALSLYWHCSHLSIHPSGQRRCYWLRSRLSVLTLSTMMHVNKCWFRNVNIFVFQLHMSTFILALWGVSAFHLSNCKWGGIKAYVWGSFHLMSLLFISVDCASQGEMKSLDTFIESISLNLRQMSLCGEFRGNYTKTRPEKVNSFRSFNYLHLVL